MATRTLLRTEDARPRVYEVIAFALSLLIALGLAALPLEPEYRLEVAEAVPGRVVVSAGSGGVDLEPGDAVGLVLQGASPDGAGATVEAVSAQRIVLATDGPVDAGRHDVVVVRAPARPALAALVGRILR
ncbi:MULTISPECIES: hypothetical protein [Actinomyces]|uniref:Uncharacterized protein n=1 Tax=Actinomyces respiraculi TaxID=2744574 RepID=A0A7T0LKS0_9ACTO|nr:MULTISPECIES: hypothetical protein [Actinomyces]QPL05566.1 hypothetical protein ID810_00785 [Actinomyces respiraculi]